MTRRVSITVGVVLAIVLSVLAASAPPVTAANTSMAASDGLVVENPRYGPTTGGIQA